MRAVSDISDKGVAYYAYFFQAKRGRSRFRKTGLGVGGGKMMPALKRLVIPLE